MKTVLLASALLIISCSSSIAPVASSSLSPALTSTASPTPTERPAVATTATPGLAETTGSLGGTVTKRGQPFAGFYITIWPTTVDKPCDFKPGPIDMTTKSDGSFGPRRFLSPGQYFVVGRFNSNEHVWAKWPGYGSNWFYESGDCETATLITLAAGQQVNLVWDIR